MYTGVGHFSYMEAKLYTQNLYCTMWAIKGRYLSEHEIANRHRSNSCLHLHLVNHAQRIRLRAITYLRRAGEAAGRPGKYQVCPPNHIPFNQQYADPRDVSST